MAAADSAADFPQPEPGHTKVCHYAVLDLERTATEADIKRAYRKAAMRWHPDKNRDRPELAARIFLLIQEAYEVLNDPQERGWYDSHRLSILRRGGKDSAGSSGGADDDFHSSDWLYAFFSTGCYPAVDAPDSPQGFYGVYGAVFQRLVDLEIQERREQDAEEGRPGTRDYSQLHPEFGDSKTGWEAVRGFYQHWGQFVSARSFSWTDAWELSQAPGRKVRRLMEAENKKARAKARKDYNALIRQLVAFVRKRDTRVSQMQLAADKEALRKRKEEAARSEAQRKQVEQRRAEHRRLQQERLQEERAAYLATYGGDSDEADSQDEGADEGDLTEDHGEDREESDVDAEELESPAGRSRSPAKSGRRPKKKSSGRQSPSSGGGVGGGGGGSPRLAWICNACSKNFKSEPQFLQHLESRRHKQELAALGLTPEEERLLIFGEQSEDESESQEEPEEEDDDGGDQQQEDEDDLEQPDDAGEAAAAEPSRSQHSDSEHDDDLLDEEDAVLAEMLLSATSGLGGGGGRSKRKQKRGGGGGGFGIVDEELAELQVDLNAGPLAGRGARAAKKKTGARGGGNRRNKGGARFAADSDSEPETPSEASAVAAAVVAEDEDSDDDADDRRTGKRGGKKGRGKGKKKSAAAAAAAPGVTAPPRPVKRSSSTTSETGGTTAETGVCQVCHKVFPSRSKLFQHLKETGHAVLKR